MSQSTYVKENYQPKVHFSEYLKTGNMSVGNETFAAASQLTPTKAEWVMTAIRYIVH